MHREAARRRINALKNGYSSSFNPENPFMVPTARDIELMTRIGIKTSPSQRYRSNFVVEDVQDMPGIGSTYQLDHDVQESIQVQGPWRDTDIICPGDAEHETTVCSWAETDVVARLSGSELSTSTLGSLADQYPTPSSSLQSIKDCQPNQSPGAEVACAQLVPNVQLALAPHRTRYSPRLQSQEARHMPSIDPALSQMATEHAQTDQTENRLEPCATPMLPIHSASATTPYGFPRSFQSATFNYAAQQMPGMHSSSAAIESQFPGSFQSAAFPRSAVHMPSMHWTLAATPPQLPRSFQSKAFNQSAAHMPSMHSTLAAASPQLPRSFQSTAFNQSAAHMPSMHSTLAAASPQLPRSFQSTASNQSAEHMPSINQLSTPNPDPLHQSRQPVRQPLSRPSTTHLFARDFESSITTIAAGNMPTPSLYKSIYSSLPSAQQYAPHMPTILSACSQHMSPPPSNQEQGLREMHKRTYRESFDLDEDDDIRALKAQLLEKRKEMYKRQKVKELKNELARLEHQLELQ